jgi:hypothetical protein
LNQVHLRIPHALKETSYLTDTTLVTDCFGLATTIRNSFSALTQGFRDQGMQFGALPRPKG